MRPCCEEFKCCFCVGGARTQTSRTTSAQEFAVTAPESRFVTQSNPRLQPRDFLEGVITVDDDPALDKGRAAIYISLVQPG
jgi:hypothetical protein